MSTKQQLNQAFRELRKAGYFARQNFWCCSSCACADIPQAYGNKFVFYHKQAGENLQHEGQCYLQWGMDGNAHEIVDILRKNGVQASWEGSENNAILITGVRP